jgi:hypothetical protein
MLSPPAGLIRVLESMVTSLCKAVCINWLQAWDLHQPPLPLAAKEELRSATLAEQNVSGTNRIWLIRERIRPGLASARAMGARRGRPKVIPRLANKGLSLIKHSIAYQAAADESGVSISTSLHSQEKQASFTVEKCVDHSSPSIDLLSI